MKQSIQELIDQYQKKLSDAVNTKKKTNCIVIRSRAIQRAEHYRKFIKELNIILNK